MKKRTKSLIAIGLVSTLAGCGDAERQAEKTVPPPVSSNVPEQTPETSEAPVQPRFKVLGRGAVSGCDLKKASKIIRRKVIKGEFFKVMTITDRAGNEAESIAKNNKVVAINPGVLVCKGEITAFIGTSQNMKAKTTNTYDPVRLIRKEDPGATMMAADRAGQLIPDFALSPADLHFDRTQGRAYQDGLTDRQGRSYASVVPTEAMDELFGQPPSQSGLQQ